MGGPQGAEEGGDDRDDGGGVGWQDGEERAQGTRRKRNSGPKEQMDAQCSEGQTQPQGPWSREGGQAWDGTRSGVTRFQ